MRLQRADAFVAALKHYREDLEKFGYVVLKEGDVNALDVIKADYIKLSNVLVAFLTALHGTNSVDFAPDHILVTGTFPQIEALVNAHLELVKTTPPPAEVAPEVPS